MKHNILNKLNYRKKGKDYIGRTGYERDYDRIIFSNPFRRLSRKTQVHPLSKNDHIHNRMSHSLEVASVGRSLGLYVGKFLKKIDKNIKPYDIAYIVQTACLIHDIGNTPFGHTGQDVIKEWFKKEENKRFTQGLNELEILDFKHLDGNAQSFRIVSKLENMNLTYGVLASIVKYPHGSKECEKIQKSKFSYFLSEKEIFDEVFSTMNLKTKDKYKRFELSYLMEIADDICYGLIDLQDAIELKIISLDEVKEIFILLTDKGKWNEIINKGDMNDTTKIASLISLAIANLTNYASKIFESNYKKIKSKHCQPKDLLELFDNQDLKNGLEKAKEFANKRIFNNPKKLEIEVGAYTILETLLDNLIPAIYELYSSNNTSHKTKSILALFKIKDSIKSESLYDMYQRAMDIIIGMTDDYSKYIANRLNAI